ncbi:MAG: NADP-dependent oxidoreductase [Chloroflexota bacterium]
MAAMMKASRLHEYGAPDVMVYEDAPRPEAGIGEILVRVHAAGINPVDFKTRRGKGMGGGSRNLLPLIVGWDVSGVVEAIGTGVTNYQPGDEVYAMVRFPEIGGAYAQYIAAPISDFALKPQDLDHIHAAAVPLAALTAWQIMFNTAHLVEGQRILIHAAAGGVGHLAVQLAKWKGAYVIGTASARNADFLHEIGVDEVVDYTAAPFEDVVQPVDVVLDCVGGDISERSVKVLKPGGFLGWITGGLSKERAAELGIRAGGILVHVDGEELAAIGTLIDTGYIKPFVEQVFPLSDAPKAHEAIETGRTRGKIVLSVE